MLIRASDQVISYRGSRIPHRTYILWRNFVLKKKDGLAFVSRALRKELRRSAFANRLSISHPHFLSLDISYFPPLPLNSPPDTTS
jgi:hypothetical protein